MEAKARLSKQKNKRDNKQLGGKQFANNQSEVGTIHKNGNREKRKTQEGKN